MNRSMPGLPVHHQLLEWAHNLPEYPENYTEWKNPAPKGNMGFPGGAQISSVTQSCLALCDPMNRSTPGLPVHHQLPESTQTHVH